MKRLISFLVFIVVSTNLIAQTKTTCADFESLKPGTKLCQGNSFTSGPFTFSVGSYTDANGQVYDGKKWCGIVTKTMAFNTSKTEIMAAYNSFELKLPQPIDGLSFKAQSLGGNSIINVSINGKQVNVTKTTDLSSISGQSIGGVVIQTDPSNPQHVQLRGKISQFSIGGVELLLDDFCSNEASGCLNFEDLQAGASYTTGDQIQTGGEFINLEPFELSKGNMTNGSVEVANRPIFIGSGNRLFVSNTNIHFKLRCPIKSFTAEVANNGGNLNIKINGKLLNVRTFQDANGQRVGGVDLHVTFNSQKRAIQFLAKGPIESIEIGGQELYVDNVCFGDCLEK